MYAWKQKKQPNLKIRVKTFQISFVIYSPKLENVGTKIPLQEVDQESFGSNLSLSNFDSYSLTYDHALFSDKNSPNIAKSNRIFSGKERGNKVLVLTYLDSPVADVFRHYCLFFYVGHLKAETGDQSSTKSTYSPVRPFSVKTRIFQKVFKQCCFLLEYYLWSEVRQYWTIFGGVRTQQYPKKGHFVDSESIRKTLKIFYLITTNATLMKLTTIMYLHECVNRKALRGRNPVFWLNL